MIKLDWTLLLQFANFMILLVVLNVLLFKPLRNVLAARKATIDGDLAKARSLDEQIQAQVAEYEVKLQGARQRGSQERLALRQAAQAEEARLLGTANEKATQRLQVLKEQVAGEAEAARQGLRGETEALARQIAGKVLGRSV
ncbi:MAG: ATP synthase F0 subunit B [Desulfuromonadales bacterium]